MRFEGKHSYFKNIARTVRCFKNIPKTLADWHQRETCYKFNMFCASQLLKQTKIGPGKLYIDFMYQKLINYISQIVKLMYIDNVPFKSNIQPFLRNEEQLHRYV